jgi:hypothetical protein
MFPTIPVKGQNLPKVGGIVKKNQLSKSGIEQSKVKLQSELLEFADSSKHRLTEFTEKELSCGSEFAVIKTGILSLRSKLDKFINKLIGLELQVNKNTESLCKGNYKMVKSAAILHTPSNEKEKNIVMHGLPPRIMQSDLDVNLKTFFDKSLNVKIANFSTIQIGNSLFVKLNSMDDKKQIFRNCRKLKSCKEKISIVDDHTPEEREKRRGLLKLLWRAKEHGRKAYLRDPAVCRWMTL